MTRLVSKTDPAAELRVAILPVLKVMGEHYFPWGTGFGAFERVYLIHEPDALLSPAYVNHAHNDWLELIITGGLPGATLVAALAVAVISRTVITVKNWHHSGTETGLALLGFTFLCYIALGSLADYPLRVPIIQCVFALALVWIFAPKPGHPTRGARN